MTESAAASPAASGSVAGAAAQRRLLSWVRDGVAARAGAQDPGHGPLPARLVVTTGLTVNGAPVPGPNLTLHGPGDVTALDARQVVRTDPVQGASAFEPDHLALVEFDDPGLPWRLTPAAPHPEHGLRPWLVLVALDATVPGVSPAARAGDRLPVLTVPISELPDLAGSAAWAHAEVTAADGEDTGELLRNAPERSVSRLIAPRRLTAGRPYLACVVPAFEHGRLAGLGRPVTGDTTAPAWQGTTGIVELPVYYHWSFTAGPDGDFSALAQRLHAVPADPGLRVLSYGNADPELRSALGSDPGRLPLPPALTAPGTVLTGGPPAGYVTAMSRILARGATAVAPPVHLGAHAGRDPGWTGTGPPWLKQLNIDPRLRAAAGLGAEVVRIHQETLIASAWRQAADLDRVNRELAQGRLGQTVAESLHQRFFDATPDGSARTSAVATGLPDVLVMRAATAAGRLPGLGLSATGNVGLAGIDAGAEAAATESTIADDLAQHPPTAAVASADFQRVARPVGPVARAAGATTEQPLPAPVGPVANAVIVPAPPVRASAATGVFDRYSGTTVKYRQITPQLVGGVEPWWQHPQGRTLPACTPGPIGYLADLVVMQREPGSGSPASLAVHRDIDFDGRPRRMGSPFPVPDDPPAPNFRILGMKLGRLGTDSEPSLVQLGVENYQNAQGDPRARLWTRSIPGIGQSGHGPAEPWAEFDDFGLHFAPIRAGDITLWGRPVPTLVVVTREDYDTEYAGDGLRLATADPQGAVSSSPVTALHGAFSPPLDVAIDMVPYWSGDGQPYEDPRDLLFAWVENYVENEDIGYPIYRRRLCWRLIKNYERAGQTSTPVRELAAWSYHDDPEDPFRPQISVSVTDIDGDGKPDLIFHYTDRTSVPGPDGSPQPQNVLYQIVGHGLKPDGYVSSWSAPLELSIEPGGIDHQVITALGDIDNDRPARLRRMGDRFKAAAQTHQAALINAATEAPPPPTSAPYDVTVMANALSELLRPEGTLPPRVLDRIESGGAALPDGPPDAAAHRLRPRRYEPSFPQAMADPLRELFPELVFPAAEGMPEDSVALMAGNPELIAAYLGGVNEAFRRELLWRGYPSSGRATWFRRFFDARGAGSAYDGDILDIADWGESELASVVTGPAASDNVVLLVRAELLRRFPGAMVQMVEAQWTGRPAYRDPAGRILAPSFVGRAGVDVSMFSFPISPAVARGAAAPPGSAGWFFVFAEPPAASRFATDHDLAWSAPAAQTAAALMRPPFRIAIHATDLLPLFASASAAFASVAPTDPGTTA